MNLTRDLINRPPQEITPVGFARRAEQAARDAGLRFEEWDQTRLDQERMQFAAGGGERGSERAAANGWIVKFI